jgi:hypothetical protein
MARRRYITPPHLSGVEVSQSRELLEAGLETPDAANTIDKAVREDVSGRKVHAPAVGQDKTVCGRIDAPVAGPLDRVTCARCLQLLTKR